MSDIKLIKKLLRLQLKRQAVKELFIQAIVLSICIVINLIHIFEKSVGEVKENYIENTSFYLLIIYGIILAVRLAARLYQDDGIAIFPGNAKTRFWAKIFGDGLTILMYAGMMAAVYSLMALLYLVLSKTAGAYIPGVFDLEYMGKGILYLTCVVIIFYCIFALIALVVRNFGIYGILGAFGLGIIYIVGNFIMAAVKISDFFEKSILLHNIKKGMEFVFNGFIRLIMSLVGIAGLRSLCVMAAVLLAASLIIHRIAIIWMRAWKRSSAQNKGIYFGIIILFLNLVFVVTALGSAFMYDGFGISGVNEVNVEDQDSVKEKLISARENQIAEKLVQVDDIKYITSTDENDEYTAEQRWQDFFRTEFNAVGQMGIGGYAGAIIYEFVPESKAVEYGISLPAKLQENQIYLKFYFENATFNGDFLLNSTIDSMNESFTIGRENCMCEVPAKKFTLINDFLGDRATVTFDKYSLLQADVTIAIVVRDEDIEKR